MLLISETLNWCTSAMSKIQKIIVCTVGSDS